MFTTKEKFSLIFKQPSDRFNIPIQTLFRWQRKMHPNITRNKSATTLDIQALAKGVELAPNDNQWERAKRFNDQTKINKNVEDLICV